MLAIQTWAKQYSIMQLLLRFILAIIIISLVFSFKSSNGEWSHRWLPIGILPKTVGIIGFSIRYWLQNLALLVFAYLLLKVEKAFIVGILLVTGVVLVNFLSQFLNDTYPYWTGFYNSIGSPFLYLLAILSFGLLSFVPILGVLGQFHIHPLFFPNRLQLYPALNSEAIISEDAPHPLRDIPDVLDSNL